MGRKQKQIWATIVPENTLGLYKNAIGIVNESVQITFDDEWDVMPARRKKYIHLVGAVCPFVAKTKDTPFNGILQNGEAPSLIHLGATGPLGNKPGVNSGGVLKLSDVTKINPRIWHSLSWLVYLSCNN